jgi:hypothetical protein
MVISSQEYQFIKDALDENIFFEKRPNVQSLKERLRNKIAKEVDIAIDSAPENRRNFELIVEVRTW